MKAVTLSKYGQLELLEQPRPFADSHEVLLRVSYAGICGTDMHIFAGEMHGRTRLPLIPGHEFAGTIVEIGAEVDKYNVGDRVAVDPIYWCGSCPACLLGHFPGCSSLKLKGIDANGGFAEYVVVDDFMLYPIPDAISDRNAALIEVYAIGFHAMKRSKLKDSDSVLIWGAGRIGQSILQTVMTRPGTAPVFLVDVLDTRLKIAKDAYPDIVTLNPLNEDPLERMRETCQYGVDVSFEAVGHAREIEGSPNPLRGCVQAIRGGGTVCALGLADETTPLLMKELIWKEAQIIASRVTHGEFDKAIEQLAAGNLKPELLISAEYPAGEAQRAFEELQVNPEKYLKVLLRMN